MKTLRTFRIVAFASSIFLASPADVLAQLALKYEGSVDVGFSGIGDIVTTDLNGDNFADFVVSEFGSYDVPRSGLAVFLRQSDGSFAKSSQPGTGIGPLSIAMARLDSDAFVDLVTANWGSFTTPGNTISVLYGNSDGAFDQQLPYPTPAYPREVRIADLNNDGLKDIAVVNTTSPGAVCLLLNLGGRQFGSATCYSTIAYPLSLAISDFNLDGSLDIAIASVAGAQLEVLLNNGSGAFYTHLPYVSPYSHEHLTLAAADLDADGIPDVVYGHWGGWCFLSGAGDGTFKKPTCPAAAETRRFAIADLNGDGSLDVASGSQGAFQIHLHDINIGFCRSWVTQPEDIPVLADMNSDSRPDLLVAGQSNVSILTNEQLFTGSFDLSSPLQCR